jgi:lipooligosaccharide transport system permease protein
MSDPLLHGRVPDRVTAAAATAGGTLRILPPGLLAGLNAAAGGRGALRLIERHARAYRHAWYVLFSGFFEPVFYLLSIGIGIGKLVGSAGYTSFVAPALLATSAMNGAVFDTTFSVLFLLKYAKLYDAALATPLRPGDLAIGQIGWAVIRGGLYSIAFVVVMLAMGLVHSAFAVFALPAALLIAFAFAGAGMAASTYMTSWQHFEYVTLATLPMFLFSATFYPLSVYPRPLQFVVEITPLYQGVALLRGLTTGFVGPAMLANVAYLALMGTVGLYVAGLRIGKLLLR